MKLTTYGTCGPYGNMDQILCKLDKLINKLKARNISQKE